MVSVVVAVTVVGMERPCSEMVRLMLVLTVLDLVRPVALSITIEPVLLPLATSDLMTPSMLTVVSFLVILVTV